MTEKVKPPVWFWIVSVIALIWNGLGVSAYLQAAYLNEETKAALPPEQVAYFENLPAWAMGAFAMAVFSATLGSILLLLRKKVAYWFFMLSFLSVIVQSYYDYFVNEVEMVMDAMAVSMSIMIPVFAILLIWFARTGRQKGWLT